MEKHLVVNFFGGPGCGKTVAASDLFVALKKKDVETFLVTEFAQELILAGNLNSLKDQFFVSGNQYHRIKTAYDNFSVTIIDSPLLLGIVYQTNLPAAFNELLLELHNSFHSLNVLLTRSSNNSHTLSGRIHGLTESLGLDREIHSMLDRYNILYYHQDRSPDLVTKFLTEQIMEFLNNT